MGQKTPVYPRLVFSVFFVSFFANCINFLIFWISFFVHFLSCFFPFLLVYFFTVGNLKRSVFMEPSLQRSRKFTCITYLSELQLQNALQSHYSQLRGFAYALHDKDVNKDGTPKEPHTHVVLWLYNASTIGRIRRWFRALDSSGKEITTTAQVCKDVVFAYEYLYHRNDPDKFQYSPYIITASDPALFEKDDPDDNALNALNDICAGSSLYECAQRYGRDFIYHFRHMESLVTAIKIQQSGGDPFAKK